MRFPDVQASKWYAKNIEKATAAGIMVGYEDGTFRPDQPLTRAEAATIVATLLKKLGKGQ